MNRVVITGIGVVSPVGCELQAFWDALVEGRSGIGPITTVPTERLAARIAAEVRDYRPEAHFTARATALMDRVAQFGVVAARSALADAGLVLDENLARHTAAIIGTGVGGQLSQDEAYHRLYGENAPRLHPFTIPRLMVNSASSHISMDLGIRGPTFTIASACASGTHALGVALDMVRAGRVPMALAGGAEACLAVGTIKGWEALRVLSNDTCRPFSRTRSGLVLGEGAAILVLETLDAARARGARTYAELRGYGMTADAADVTAPDAEGEAAAMRAALADAGLPVDAIDYINAHGTGTALNDATETAAIRAVFGEHAKRLAVSSCKAVLGHGLGAAGALEAAATALALHHGILPPTANFEEPDPACDLDVIPNIARQQQAAHALSNSFAFGGLNAVLVFSAL
ncbi:MAG TPA: beta-ketoacyl-[acyl-carrier-protein] synthase family protein [Stellaceae bacterium]|nr:beta-ketoacyl-[acyl-carrier-protein] synthase family protein [Stellaceae bacterium]